MFHYQKLVMTFVTVYSEGWSELLEDQNAFATNIVLLLLPLSFRTKNIY